MGCQNGETQGLDYWNDAPATTMVAVTRLSAYDLLSALLLVLHMRFTPILLTPFVL